MMPEPRSASMRCAISYGMNAQASVPSPSGTPEPRPVLVRNACSAPSLAPTKTNWGRLWLDVMYVSSVVRSPAEVALLVYQYGACGAVSSAAVELSMPPSTESVGFKPKRCDCCHVTSVLAAGEFATLS